MSPVYEVPPFPWKLTLATMPFLVVGVVCLGLVPGKYADLQDATTADVCAPGKSTQGCLEAVQAASSTTGATTEG